MLKKTRSLQDKLLYSSLSTSLGVPVELEYPFGMGQVKGVVVYAIVGVVLFRGMSEIIHRESNLHILRSHTKNRASHPRSHNKDETLYRIVYKVAGSDPISKRHASLANLILNLDWMGSYRFDGILGVGITWQSALLSNLLIFVLGSPILVSGLSLSGIASAFLLGTPTWRAFGPSGFLLVATSVPVEWSSKELSVTFEHWELYFIRENKTVYTLIPLKFGRCISITPNLVNNLRRIEEDTFVNMCKLERLGTLQGKQNALEKPQALFEYAAIVNSLTLEEVSRMTSFSVDETSNQSCSSPVLGKRKSVKPPSSDVILNILGLLVNIVELHMLVIPKEMVPLI
uniref:Uncharacterized protein n=1 Tax=Cucumis melo TaxID=3656 RepID=A0A9I9ECV5_CUCME